MKPIKQEPKFEKWNEFVIDHFFANYDFEYFNPQRESHYNGTICNQIIFPKAENGRLVSRLKLKMVIEEITADDNLSEKIFGPGVTDVNVIEDPMAFRIIWNSIPVQVYDQLDNDKIEALYKF